MTTTTYRNAFYQKVRDAREWIETQAQPQEYRGYLLYHRIHGVLWDVVRDGLCVGQYAGRGGAERFVDLLLGETV